MQGSMQIPQHNPSKLINKCKNVPLKNAQADSFVSVGRILQYLGDSILYVIAPWLCLSV